MVPCPDPIELERFLSGELDGGSRRRIERHLADCPQCRDHTDDISENMNLIARAKDILPAPSGEGHPTHVGPFRILREIGRGGMGVVFLAEQERPQRRVALKVVAPGLASSSALTRFDREADALARLEHPCIARILEAGVSPVDDAGGWTEPRPWFAMEYVDGPALDTWVREANPLRTDRLSLLADVADAIHHAHVNGVVHRDLKPGNVLVEHTDGLHPKVLDFGIARVMDAEGPTQTEMGGVVGTIPFMSPEQVVGDPSRVNAKTDIYSIGVLAYWLLSGELPHRVRDRSLPEAARIIHEEDPRSLAALDPTLAGDLDTIVARCLEKDPERRYASAAAVADDLRRFLAHEPVLARPPSTSYAFRKFVRRNRALVAAATSVLVIVVVAAVVGSSLALRARRAERAANQSLDRAEAINEFLVGMLGSANPEFDGDRETTVREVLENAANELEAGRLTDHPETEASVRRVIGNTYGILGHLDEGEAQLREALALAERGGIYSFHYLTDLGLLIKDVPKFAEAESLFLASLDVARQRSDDAAVALAFSNAAAAVMDQGDFARGESLLVQSIGSPDMDEPLRVTNLNNLGVLGFRRGDYAVSAARLREALPLSRDVFGDDHPSTLLTIGNLGRTLLHLEELPEAEALLREALTGTKRVFGDRHVRTGLAHSQLAAALRRSAPEAEALRHYRDALSILEDAAGPDDPRTVQVREALAELTEER